MRPQAPATEIELFDAMEENNILPVVVDSELSAKAQRSLTAMREVRDMCNG